MSKGECGAFLARMYGVGTSTTSDLKRKKDSLLEYASKLDSQEGSKNRKTFRTANNSALEDAEKCIQIKKDWSKVCYYCFYFFLFLFFLYIFLIFFNGENGHIQ